MTTCHSETTQAERETAVLIAARPGLFEPWPTEEAIALIELLREDEYECHAG